MSALASRFAANGDCRCYAGEAIVLELAFDDGSGGTVDLAGRSFAFTLYRTTDRSQLASVQGETLTDDDGHFVRFSIGGATTEGLWGSRLNLAHEVAELNDAGREVWIAGKLALDRSPASVAPSLGANAAPATRYVFDRRARRALISAKGAPGARGPAGASGGAIDDEQTSSASVWSSHKTSEAVSAKLDAAAFTKAGIGLNNVDNTADADKPVSTQQADALAAKLDAAAFTKTGLGLGNVNNTSDANKPISSAQQAALDNKASKVAPVITGGATMTSADFLTGTLSNGGAGDGNIVGAGTAFLAECKVGDSIEVQLEVGIERQNITAIASDTAMTTTPFVAAFTDRPAKQTVAQQWRFLGSGTLAPPGSNIAGLTFGCIFGWNPVQAINNGSGTFQHIPTYQVPTFTYSGTGVVLYNGIYHAATLSRTQNGTVNAAGLEAGIAPGTGNTGNWNAGPPGKSPAGIRGTLHSSSALTTAFAVATAIQAVIDINSGTWTKLFGFCLPTMQHGIGTVTNAVGMGLYNIGRGTSTTPAVNKCYIYASLTQHEVPTGDWFLYDNTGYNSKIVGGLDVGSFSIGGVAVVAPPAIPTGRWFLPEGSGLPGGAGLAGAQDNIRGYPVRLRRAITLTDLKTIVTTAAASGNFQIAIYAAHATTCAPTGAPLYVSGSVSTAGTAPFEAGVTGLSVALAPGLYWLFTNCDANANAAVFRCRATGQALTSELVGSSVSATAVLSVINLTGFSKSQTFNTWPTLTGSFSADGFSEVAAGSIPMLAVKS